MILISALLSLLAPQNDPAQDVEAFSKKLRALCDKIRPAFVHMDGGSAVCISPDGWVLTNHHVAGASGTATVHLAGGKAVTYDVIGHDPLGDVSLLKIRDAKDLPYLDLGDSDGLRIGQFVVAMGDPFVVGNPAQGGNYEPTITFGVVSAFHRFWDWYNDAIQTDAQINPGNSGGPLITLEGKVIGINGRIWMRHMTRVNTGLGFAISSAQIKRFMPYFKMGGRVYHGMIDGITVAECGTEDLDGDVGEYGQGVLVAGVAEPTPGSKAGLEPNDIIVELGGYKVYNKNRFFGVCASFPHGETVKVKYVRKEGGEWKSREGEVFLGDPEKKYEADSTFQAIDFGFHPRYDHQGPGLKVGTIEEPARTSGLVEGDVVTEADGKEIKEFLDLVNLLVTKKPGQEMKLKVKRGDATAEVAFKLGKNKDAPENPHGPRPPGPPEDPPRDE